MLFTLVVPIEVIYAKESLGTSNAGFGSCSRPGASASWSEASSTCLSATIGARSDRRLDRDGRVAYLGLATADTLLVACLISVVGGAGNGVQWISVVTTLQEVTPADYQARIVGLLESLGAAMPGIGYLIEIGWSPSVRREPPTPWRGSASSCLSWRR